MELDPELIAAVTARSLVAWTEESFHCEGFAHHCGPGSGGEPLMLVWRTIRGRMDSPKPDWVLVRAARTPPAVVPGGPTDHPRVLPFEYLQRFRETSR